MDWKRKTYLFGGLIGLAFGILAALIIIQRSEKNEIQPKMTAGDGVKIGMGALGVLRLISDLFSQR